MSLDWSTQVNAVPSGNILAEWSCLLFVGNKHIHSNSHCQSKTATHLGSMPLLQPISYNDLDQPSRPISYNDLDQPSR